MFGGPLHCSVKRPLGLGEWRLAACTLGFQLNLFFKVSFCKWKQNLAQAWTMLWPTRLHHLPLLLSNYQLGLDDKDVSLHKLCKCIRKWGPHTLASQNWDFILCSISVFTTFQIFQNIDVFLIDLGRRIPKSFLLEERDFFNQWVVSWVDYECIST